MATTAATATTTITIVPPPPGGDSGDGGGCGARPGGNGGGDGQTAAGIWLHDDQDELGHRGLADQVEAIRALLQSLRESVPSNVLCDRLSQTVGKRRACERWEARSRSERKRERVRRHGGVMRWR